MELTDLNIDNADHTAPLEADNVPDVNQAHYCFSCKAPVTGLHCSACGQKNDDYRRSITSLIKEVLGSVTGIESRIWRTWAAVLFRPGVVPREYADGRRTHWSSPVRVYLTMSLILFTFLGVTQTQIISADLNVVPKPGVVKPVDELRADDLTIKPAIHFFETKGQIEKRNKERNFDLIAIKLKNDGKTEQGERVFQLSRDGTVYKVTDWPEVVFAFIRDPETLNGALLKYLPRAMFLMMPFTMFLGALFIRGRKNALLYDHLVHAAYVHAFAFFMVLLGITLSSVMKSGLVADVLGYVLLIWLVLSLKRMFGRGWIKTIWTTLGVGVIYCFVILAIVSGFVGAQMLDTVTRFATPVQG